MTVAMEPTDVTKALDVELREVLQKHINSGAVDVETALAITAQVVGSLSAMVCQSVGDTFAMVGANIAEGCDNTLTTMREMQKAQEMAQQVHEGAARTN